MCHKLIKEMESNSESRLKELIMHSLTEQKLKGELMGSLILFEDTKCQGENDVLCDTVTCCWRNEAELRRGMFK